MRTLRIIAVLLLAVAPLFAQQHAKKLILKDGSYQMATRWEIQGDRVRYYSAERYMWEEVPKDLVDWAATDKAATATPPAAQPEAAADADDAALFAAPNLRLPDQGGIYLLDTYKGQKQLVELVQNGSQLNKQMGRNILRSVINPLPTGAKQTFELKGARAAVQSHSASPFLFINVNYDTGDAKLPSIQDRFRIIRLQPKDKDDKRIVANVKVALVGKTKEQRNVIPSMTEQLNSDWVKITPNVALEPGEYAVAEMLNDQQMNMFVWDFGVDPNAPANPSAWKPKTPAKTDTGTQESPVLTQRPK